MYCVCVNVTVKAGCEDKFIEATLANARATRREAGNVRFDVVQAEDDTARFMLYEVYLSKDDFTRHQQTQHYLAWKAGVADMMAQPRSALKGSSVFFGDGHDGSAGGEATR